MNNNLDNLNSLTEKIIGCSIEVHRNLGPGLLESIYEKALIHEFHANSIGYQRQVVIPIKYKGYDIGIYRLDFLIEESIIIELKATNRFDPVYEAQLMTYLKITNKKLGLLINFNVPQLRHGIKRIIL